MNPDDIKANVAKLVAAGAPEQDIHDYITAAGFPQVGTADPAPTHHNKPKIGQMGHAITTDESDEGGAPGIGTKTLGVIAALNRDIPGAEAAQAGVRSLVRGQSYASARNDIRGAEDAAPLAATVPARLLGGGLAAVAGGRALNLGAKGAGALYGGLSGLGDSDVMSKDDRVANALGGAAIGGLAGAAGQKVGALGAKVLRPVMRGVSSVGREALGSAPAIARQLESLALPAEALRTPLAEAASGEGKSVANVVAKQSHRTAAQFQNFAEQMGQDPPQPQTLGGLLSKLRASQPNEPGNAWGDAEEAMGTAPHQQPDLEALLRESLNRLKPTT
jgi:hypothetical protein